MSIQFKNILKAFDGSFKRGRLNIPEKSKGHTDINGVDLKDAVAFSGLIDVGTLINEPGFEFRESLRQTEEAALAGGFHSLLAMSPDENLFDSKTFIEYILRKKARKNAPHIYPIANLTVQKAGKDFVEFNDLHNAGAIAFSDGLKPIKDAGLLLRALEYVKSFDGMIITSPIDKELYPHGQMHEGNISTSLGLSGIPSITEEIMVNRDISLAKLANGKIHIYCISTIGSIELIKKAKKEGLKVSCSVSVNNLIFCDEDLLGYNSDLKLIPPIRDNKTRKALWKAVEEGVIDVIVTQHQPLEPELKDLEFLYADFGAMGLQTAIPALIDTYGMDAAAPVIQQAMCDRVKEIFGLDIDTGIVIFGKKPKKLNREDLISNCYNSPFLDRELQFQLI